VFVNGSGRDCLNRDYDDLLHKRDNPDHIYFGFIEISAIGKNMWFA